jgi:hypothetical protein
MTASINPNVTTPPTDTTPSSPRPNALTHGLTAASLLNPHEIEIYREHVNLWTRELGHCCDAEKALIETGAVARVRIERCLRLETASAPLARTRALKKLTAKRRHAARKTAQSFSENPRLTLRLLRATPEGCEWLIARLSEIDDHLALGRNPDVPRLHRLLNICGLPTESPGPEAPPQAIRLWWLHIVLQPLDNPLSSGKWLRDQAFRDGIEPPADLPATPQEARAEIRMFISDLIQVFTSDREKALAALADERALEEEVAQAEALIDDSRSNRLRKRYEQEAKRDLQRSVTTLLRIRQDRRRADAQNARLEGAKFPPPTSPAFPVTFSEPDLEPAPQSSRNETPGAPAPANASSSSEANLCSQAEARDMPAPERTDRRTTSAPVSAPTAHQAPLNTTTPPPTHPLTAPTASPTLSPEPSAPTT